uniref:NOT2/NOT3/NOT5 C-terminal domain-containing protein n=1 Tax=Pseudo-nitzschia delicatissima TaxID=44447 RepID=A0A7S0UGH2_9STRA
MEAFKYCEKETKTKTYSKEGLAKAEKLTPEEEAKKATCEWITEIIEKLTQMAEEKDLEVERLAAGRGKKTNKNLIEECNHFLSMHRFHLTKLEGIMRLVNNDVLDVEVVDPLKEDLEYYIDSYEDDDYQQAYDEDFFYEALGLDTLQVVNVDRVTQASAEKEKSKKDPYSDLASSSSKGSEKGSKKSKKSSASSMIPLTIGRARKGKKSALATSSGSKSSRGTASDSPNDASNSGDDDSSNGNTPTKVRRGMVGVPTPTTIPATSTGTSSMAAILKRETEQQEKERAQKAAEQLRLQQLQQQQQQAAIRAQQQQAEMLRQQQEAQLRQQQAEAAAKQKAMQEQQALQQAQMRQQQEAQMRQQQQLQQQAVAQQQSDGLSTKSQNSGGSASGLDIISGLNGMSLGVPNSGGSSGASTAGSVGSGGHHRRGASGEASILSGGGNRGADSSLLQESFATIPSSNEHDRTNSRSSSYAPQNPYPSTPASFPSIPNAIFENPAIFEKLGTDALFYIFYYKQGTYQQYLAARELKKQSWRFHKKYMTWFQRHEEPKVTTDDYEQGTYVYFDWETGWCTRIKQEFTFEYAHLEDTLQ